MAQASDFQKDQLAALNQIAGALTSPPPRSIALTQSHPGITATKWLWVVIRNRAKAISFERYDDFITKVMCGDTDPDPIENEVKRKKLLLEAEQRKIRDSNLSPEEKKAAIASLDDQIKCLAELQLKKQEQRTTWQSCVSFHGTESYQALKKSTEYFLMQECGLLIDWAVYENQKEGLDAERYRLPQLEGRSDPALVNEIIENKYKYLAALQEESLPVFPYFKRIREQLNDLPLKGPGEAEPNCYGILRSKISAPCLLELIWSYWHEEGLLVQSMNAITRRFQNVRGPGDRDPLAHLEIDPLRPLNNLLWGYLEDEKNQLTLVRRAYEYDHHYGLRLVGRAVPELRPADSRSKFLEAFHNLLHLCSIFYKEIADTTVVPDGYPMLNTLKEVHLLLAEGAHNQFGDLPWTARVEMLIQQWLLARPEMRDFLKGRTMVPYPERWMDRADTMKKLQGWTDVTVRHFRDLAVFGEQIVLSIRYGDWSNENNETEARIWAWYWREEIQAYLYCYRAVTGVDLTTEVTGTQQAALRYTLPSILLAQRLAAQRQRVPMPR